MDNLLCHSDRFRLDQLELGKYDDSDLLGSYEILHYLSAFLVEFGLISIQVCLLQLVLIGVSLLNNGNHEIETNDEGDQHLKEVDCPNCVDVVSQMYRISSITFD